MKMSALEDFARTGTPEDVVNLLKKYGSETWSAVDENSYLDEGDCIDYIIKGISKDSEGRRALKQSLVAQYVAGTGPFKKEQEVTPDTVKELRATITELTARVAELEKATQKQTPSASKAPQP